MSATPKVIFVSIFAPTGDGHGGNHRTYQIWHDCQQAFGKDNVRALSFTEWQESYVADGSGAASWLRKQSLRFWRFASFCRDSLVNPARVFGSFRWAMSFHHPAFLAAYRQQVRRLGGNVVCLAEDPRFFSLLQYNRRSGIPCLLAPQNIQSFHDTSWLESSSWRNRVRAGNLRHEFAAYALAAKTLWISKVEAGVVGGMGLPAAYYPYQPNGELAEYCDEIRAAREQLSAPAKPMFLFIGSAGHPPTVASVNWLMDCVTREPLPAEVELVIVGGKTDLLAAGRTLPKNVQVLGRISNGRLKELVIAARAVVLPAFQGMGAVTRVAEMHRCGVPLLVSGHAIRALDAPPGIIALEQEWPDWLAAIKALSGDPVRCEPALENEQVALERLRRWVDEAQGSAS